MSMKPARFGEGGLDLLLRANQHDKRAGDVAPADTRRTKDSPSTGDGVLEIWIGQLIDLHSATLKLDAHRG